MPLTPQRRADIIDTLGRSFIADLLGVREDSVGNWATGHSNIPTAVDAWLAAIGELLDNPPQKPERRK